MQQENHKEIEPIAADDARAILEEAIRERLGDDWRDESNPWVVTHDADYLIRISKENTNLNFQVDLMGEVNITETEASLVQSSGRLIAWMLLIASLAVAFLLAEIAGVFN